MRPNIILINCDDLGYGDLGCYGSEKNLTPYFDKLASEGIKFTDFYSSSSVCSPSRGSLMTGCYPARIGFGTFDGAWVLRPGFATGLNPDEVTIASLLKQVGYRTMLVGKWHCGDQPEFLPTNHGFDHYYGLPYSNDMGLRSKMPKNRNYPPLPLMSDDEVLQQQPDQAALTERYLEKSIEFIRKNKAKPFFLYFAHMYVHTPIFVPSHFLKAAEGNRYSAAVNFIDLATKAICTELDRLDIRKDTLIIFTSDNGSINLEDNSNGPLRGSKGTTWEGGMRVPLIINWKGRTPVSSVCCELVCAMDLYPTIANLTGAKLPDDRLIDGIDFSSIIEGRSNNSGRNIFLYYGSTGVDNAKYGIEAIRMGDYKLHINKKGEKTAELYNLRKDIEERNNIFKKHPDQIEKMLKEIEKARQDLGDEYEGIKGTNTRQIGRVENPKCLTVFDPDHPYVVSMYDLDDD